MQLAALFLVGCGGVQVTPQTVDQGLELASCLVDHFVQAKDAGDDDATATAAAVVACLGADTKATRARAEPVLRPLMSRLEKRR